MIRYFYDMNNGKFTICSLLVNFMNILLTFFF